MSRPGNSLAQAELHVSEGEKRIAYQDAIVEGCEIAGDEMAACTAPGCLDNGLRYAARLKVSSCQTARMWAGLRWPFFSISHSAL